MDDPYNFNGMDDSIVEICGKYSSTKDFGTYPTEICETDDRIIIDPTDGGDPTLLIYSDILLQIFPKWMYLNKVSIWQKFTKILYNTKWKKKWLYDTGRPGYFSELVVFPYKVPWIFGND